MNPIEVPLALNFGEAASSVGSGGNLVNMFAKAAATGARGDIELVHTPGTKARAQLRYPIEGADLTDEGPIHAMIGAWGKIVAVGDGGTYTIGENHQWTRIGAGMAGPVSLAFNGSVVAAVNGTTAHWITEGAVTAITEPAFEPANAVTFLDGYLIFNRAGTNQVFHTELNAQSINGLDFASADRGPDKTVGVHALNDTLLILGEQTTEFWYNAGGTEFAFLRIPGAVIEHGCASIASVASEDNTAFWLTQNGSVIMVAGQQAQRISDEAVEDALARDRAHWSTARGFAYSDEGRTFYVLTCGGRSYAFDMATGYWHLRANYSVGHCLARCHVRAWGKHYVGDHRGRLLEMDRSFLTDAGEPLVSQIVTMPYSASGERLVIHALRLTMDTGHAGEGYSVRMATSKDRGHSWTHDRPKEIGSRGNYRREMVWRRLGQARDRRFRFTMSDPFPRSVLATAALEV